MAHAELTWTDLYLEDETAWLETMAELIERGAHADIDYVSLKEYLTDMARRDRREVESRLAVLLTHILTWTYQTEHRTPSWRTSIIEQRQELARLARRGVLRNHAEAVLKEIYADAIERAASETELPIETFPTECEWSVEELLSYEVTE